MRDISFLVSPIRDYAFFKKPVLQHLFGRGILKIARFGAERLYQLALRHFAPVQRLVLDQRMRSLGFKQGAHEKLPFMNLSSLPTALSP